MNILSKDHKFSQFNIRTVFLVVYVAISIATFYHTAWGFGTVMGLQPSEPFNLAWWWFVGGLSAFAVDVGMAGIVLAMVQGFTSRWLIASLVILAAFSAYAQVVYSAHHAANYPLGEVAPWLSGLLQVLLDLRVIALPLVLPLFALIYAFAAKSYQVQGDAKAQVTKANNANSAKQKQLQSVQSVQVAKPLQLKPKNERANSTKDVSNKKADIAPVQGDDLQALHGLDKVQALPVIAKLKAQGVTFDNAQLADAIGKTPSTASRWIRDAKQLQLNGDGANGKY